MIYPSYSEQVDNYARGVCEMASIMLVYLSVRAKLEPRIPNTPQGEEK